MFTFSVEAGGSGAAHRSSGRSVYEDHDYSWRGSARCGFAQSGKGTGYGFSAQSDTENEMLHDASVALLKIEMP
jgi:hypothetical protein